MRVAFSHFLRGERKFEYIDALKMQLKHDIEQTRSVSRA
ncbi:MAG: riboflavin kinase [Actinomycetota bacterium]